MDMSENDLVEELSSEEVIPARFNGERRRDCCPEVHIQVFIFSIK